MSATQLHQLLDEERARRTLLASAQAKKNRAIACAVENLHTAYLAVEPALLGLELVGDYGRPVPYAVCQTRNGANACRCTGLKTGLKIELGSTISPQALELNLDKDEARKTLVWTLTRRTRYPYKDRVLEEFDSAPPPDDLVVAMRPHLIGEVVLASASITA